MKNLRTVQVALAALLLSSCGGLSGLSGGVHTADAPGLRYRLPVDVALADVTVTTTKTTKVTAVAARRAAIEYNQAPAAPIAKRPVQGQSSTATDPAVPPRTVKSVTQVPAQITVETSTDVTHDVALQLQTVADGTKAYLLNLKPEKTRDSTLAIHVTPSGLLQSINVTSDGRGGDILKSIGHLAGTALSLVSGAPSLSTERGDDEGAKRILGESFELCDQPDGPDLVVLPIETRAMLVERDSACLAFRRLQARRRDVGAIDETLAALAKQVTQATGDTVKELKTKIELAQSQRDVANEAAGEQASYLQDLLTEYRRQRKLGVVVTTVTFHFIFDIDQLASTSDVIAKGSNGELRKALASRAQSVASLDYAGIVLTSSPQPVGEPCKCPPKTDPSGSIPTDGKTKDEEPRVRIYYRQPDRLTFTVLLTQPTMTDDDAAQPERRDNATAPVKVGLAKVAEVILPATAPHFVEFQSRAFGNGTLALKFDGSGRPTEIEQRSTASVAAALGAIDSATSAAFDAYNDTTKKLIDIQDSNRKVALSDLETRLARLKKEKEVLDASTSLKSDQATTANTLKQQQMASDLAALQADINLATAQANQQTQLDTAILKAQVDRLTQELALLKAQVELDKAKAGTK